MGFPERTVGVLRRCVLESPIDELGRALHALESLAIEAAAEGGELVGGVAREHYEHDEAEQDLGESLHPASLASSLRLQPRHRAAAGNQHKRYSM
jgi:hypothetical protein